MWAHVEHDRQGKASEGSAVRGKGGKEADSLGWAGAKEVTVHGRGARGEQVWGSQTCRLETDAKSHLPLRSAQVEESEKVGSACV